MRTLCCLATMLSLGLCINTSEADVPEKESFGTTDDGHGQKVDLYTIENENGVKAKVTNYGATLVELHEVDSKPRERLGNMRFLCGFTHRRVLPNGF